MILSADTQSRTIFTPNRGMQVEFLQRWETEVFYGGEAGGADRHAPTERNGASWLKPCRENAHIVFLIGRPTFEFINPMSHKNPDKRGKPNTDPYGKDMLLAVFGEGTGVSWWDWRKP